MLRGVGDVLACIDAVAGSLRMLLAVGTLRSIPMKGASQQWTMYRRVYTVRLMSPKELTAFRIEPEIVSSTFHVVTGVMRASITWIARSV